MKQLFLSILTGSIAYFLIGYLVFELLLGNFSKEHTTALPGFQKTEEEASMLWIFFSCVAYSTLLSVIFTQWIQVASPLEGFQKGAFIGVAVACMTNFYWFATSHFFNNFKPIFADIVAAGFTVGVMGAAIAWVAQWR